MDDLREYHERRAMRGDNYSRSLVAGWRREELTQEIRDEGIVYAVVDAPGWYGDYTRVRDVYETLAEADAARLPGRLTLIAGPYAQGERVHQLDAERGARVLAGIRQRYAEVV